MSIKAKEAEKYLINDYDQFIYNSELEFKETQRKLKKELIKSGLSKDTDEITKEEYNAWHYAIERMCYESEKHFDKAVIKYGIPLWGSDAWRKDDCRDLCPLGVVLHGKPCSKELYNVYGEMYCCGQIFLISYFLPKCEAKQFHFFSEITCFIFEDFISTGRYKAFFPNYEIKKIEGIFYT